MNDDQNQSQNVNLSESSSQAPGSGVSFPTIGQQKKTGKSKMFLTLGALILIGLLGFFIFRNSSSEIETEPTSPPSETFAPIEESPSTTPSARPADKSKVKIEIQNGTGIAGEAAYLQTQLKNLGYTNISVGNASTQNATTTTVTFSKSLASSIVDEITEKLKELYKTVEVKTSSTTSIDVLIVTGLRKGSTTRPSASSTPTTSPRASSTATSSPSPTATPL